MNASAELLDVKLSEPATGASYLARPRLHDRLQRALDGRASVVVAGPGHGKTALVSAVLAERRLDHAWYRLDPTDAEADVFFRYLFAAIRRHVDDFGDRSASLREGPAGPRDVERLADVLVRDAEESLAGRLHLVLDGLQVLPAGAPAIRALRRLLAYLPGTLHLVLIGRSIPELGLRAAGDTVTIGGDDLPFTAAETRQLLVDTFGLSLDREATDRIHRRTRGWVTALQLLRQTARLERAGDDDPFSRSEVEVFSYFSEEVLAGERDEVRRFLLVTSLLDVVEPELVGEAFADLDARRIMGHVLARHLFVSRLRGEAERYEYDPLFRDFLARKLVESEGRARVRDAHRAFGEALEGAGRHAEALEHLRLAGDAAAVARLLRERGRELLAGGGLHEVREAAGFLQAGGEQGGFLHDVLGELRRMAGDHAAAAKHFEQALDRPGAPAGLAAGAARATALQGLAFALLQLGQVERAASTARQGLDEADGGDPALLARLLNTLGIAHYRRGEHERALDCWNDGLSRARQAADSRLTLMIAHNLGLPYAVAGDYTRAAECFGMLVGPDNPRVGPEEGAAHLNLGRIALLRGDWQEAAARLEDAAEIAHKWRLEGLSGDVLEARANLLRETGRLEEAAATYARARERFTSLGLRELLDGLAEEEARLAALRGEPARALRVTEELVRRSRGAGEPAAASALLAHGEILARHGDAAAAERSLAEARAVFEDQGRNFETFLTLVWTAVARVRGGDVAAAGEPAGRAVGLASRYEYLPVLQRLAGHVPELARALPGRPELAIPPEPPATAAVPGTDQADLTVRLLGPFEVWREARAVIPASAWKLRRGLKTFCYLASARGRRATKDRLVEIAWGDADPRTVEKNFHPTISMMRRALNHGRHVPKNFIRYEAGAYLLNPDYRYDIDAERVERAMAEAETLRRRGEAAAALASYEQARALYRGPFLEDEDDEWVLGPRQHYEDLHVEALSQAGELYRAAGDRPAAVGCLEDLVRRRPLDEDASVRLMRTLGELGRREAVEREYQRLESALGEAYATSPRRETIRAHRTALGPTPEDGAD